MQVMPLACPAALQAHLSSNAWSQGQKDLQSQLDEQDAGDDAASVSSQSGSLQPGSATAASAAAGAQKLATSFMDVARETAKAARAAGGRQQMMMHAGVWPLLWLACLAPESSLHQHSGQHVYLLFALRWGLDVTIFS